MVALDASLDTYYKRMHAALGDKARLLQFVEGQDVLDVGCGDGELVALLNKQGFSAIGLDAAEESVQRAQQAGVTAHTGWADEAVTIFGREQFDTVICSSVLHEVFSYGRFGTDPGKVSFVRETVKSLYATLRPGGLLLVRDGVSPGEQDGTIIVDNPEAVENFLAASPFAGTQLDRTVALTRSDSEEERLFRFTGTASSLMEFAFTYTWGSESFEREVQEFYGLFTLEDYSSFFSETGFLPEQVFSYQQPGYVEHLEGKVTFENISFPETNAVWVLRKPL